MNSRTGDVESVLTDTTVIFAENSSKDSYNWSKLDSLSEVGIEIYANDKVLQGTPAILVENLHTQSQSSKVVWHIVSIWIRVHE